jgi:DNA polymerase-3 subunit epsilon
MRPFDADVYSLIAKRLASGQLTWIACDARPAFHLVVQDAPARAVVATQQTKRAMKPRAIAADQFALTF